MVNGKRVVFEDDYTKGIAFVVLGNVYISQQDKADPDKGIAAGEIENVVIPLAAFKAVFAELTKDMD